MGSAALHKKHYCSRLYTLNALIIVVGTVYKQTGEILVLFGTFMYDESLPIVFNLQIDEDMTARISMADAKFSFQCPGRMYSPAWMAPEGIYSPIGSSQTCLLPFPFIFLIFSFLPLSALQKKPEDINRRSADMWSFAVLLWELVTREVPFADLSNMEIGMKVATYQLLKLYIFQSAL